MGEFDLSLISEFRSRPSFYDRSSPRFKDKLYNAHEWQEISNKLGFDVSILKDRILQLRNRYNLEKRRIEQLREENPNKCYESPWPLYDHLHFLSDHIRARRSYKKMLPLNSGGGGGGGGYEVTAELSNSCSNNSNVTTTPHINTTTVSRRGRREGAATRSNAANVTAFPNGLLTVKMEEDSDETEADTESQNNDSEINTFEPSALIAETHSSSIPNQQQQQQQQYHIQELNAHKQQQQRHHQQQQHHPTISIRRLDSLRQDFGDAASSSTTNYNINSNKKRSHHTSFKQAQHNDDDSVSAALKQPRLNARELKYTAFGNFISSSLIDLPANIALELVDKFTSDIVRALIEKAEKSNDYENGQ